MSGWTREPPSEPGWYWVKDRYGPIEVVRFPTSGLVVNTVTFPFCCYVNVSDCNYEWWPTPLPPPGEDGRA